MFLGEYNYEEDMHEHYLEGLEIGWEVGFEIGCAEARLARQGKCREDDMEKWCEEVALKLIDRRISLSIIAKELHMPVEKVEELAAAVAR